MFPTWSKVTKDLADLENKTDKTFNGTKKRNCMGVSPQFIPNALMETRISKYNLRKETKNNN